MQKLEDINKAISGLITTKLGGKVISEETEEPIENAYKVLFDTTKLSQMNSAYYERTAYFDIVYYPKDTDKWKLECMRAIQRIESVIQLCGIETRDKCLRLTEIESGIDEGKAVVSVGVYDESTELYDYHDIPVVPDPEDLHMMEELEENYN